MILFIGCFSQYSNNNLKHLKNLFFIKILSNLNQINIFSFNSFLNLLLKIFLN